MKFYLWHGNTAIAEMQGRGACENGLGLELNIHSYEALEKAEEVLKNSPCTPELSVHIRRGKELSFYFTDDDPVRNRRYVGAALEFFKRSPGDAFIIHDETDPHARTLSKSRLESSVEAFRQMDSRLGELGKTLHVEFSTRLHAEPYLDLMWAMRDAGLKNVGSCIDTGHVYYYFRRRKAYSRDRAVACLKAFIMEVKATGLPLYFHVHDCDPENPHPKYHVSDHKKIGSGEIGIEGFGQITGFLRNEKVNLELLPSADCEGTSLAEEESRRLAEYAGKHGLDPREQLKDGRIIKKTLQDIVESKKIIEDILRET